MDELWREAPLGALRITGEAGRWLAEPNPAARAWGDAQGWQASDWQTLADGGQVTMPFEKQMWGDEFGMLTDRFGVPWMIIAAVKTPQ